MSDEHEPIRTIENGVIWYFEGEDADMKGKQEGKIEIYPGWVRLPGVMGTWVPRERVEQIHED